MALTRYGCSPAFRGTDLARGRRVKISAASANWSQAPTVAYAAATDANAIGVTLNDVVGEGPIGVQLRNDPVVVEVNAAIALGAVCYAAANGRVDATGTVVAGVALAAATAAGDIIPIVPA